MSDMSVNCFKLFTVFYRFYTFSFYLLFY